MDSIFDLEGRAVLGAHASTVVDPGGRNVGVPQPLLHFGDVRLVVERVGGRRGPQGMGAEPFDVDACLRCVALHDPADPIGRQCEASFQAATVIAHGLEQRGLLVLPVASSLQVLIDQGG